ncbi:MAG: PorV/PorQ family protein [Endomicrobiales bacterium]|nr:PorV/PorQ family protein [Endomicrobiales bacterium]
MKKLIVFSIILGFLLIYLYPNANAAASGVTAAEFLKINPDPSTVAMGEGAVGLVNDSPSIAYNNPAGLIGVTRPRVSLSYVLFLEGLRYHYTSFAIPFSYGTIGTSIYYLTYGEFEGKDADFNPIANPTCNDMAFQLTYAIPIRTSVPIKKDHGSVGLNLKFIRSKLADYSAEAIAIDLGGIYHLPFVEGLSMGMAYKNLGSGLKFVKETGQLPTTLSLGFNYKNPEMKNLETVLDINSPSKGPSSYSVGFEFSPMYLIKLRAGWKQMENAVTAGIRAGLGINYKDFKFDYAFSPVEYFSPVHHISITLSVGKIFNSLEAYDYYLQEHFKIGVDFYNEGDYIRAREKFKEILESYPDHDASKKYILRIDSNIEREKQKREEKVDKILRKADSAYARKDYISAKKYYAYIIKSDPSHLQAKEGLQNVQNMLKEVLLEKVRIQNSEKIKKIWKIAMEYYRRGELVNAKEKLEEILRIDAEHIESKKLIVAVDNKLKKAAAAETNKMYTQAIELYKEEKYELAMKYFEAVLLAAPHRIDAMDFAERCKEKVREREEQERKSKLAQQQESMKSDLLGDYNKALRYYEKGKFPQALHYFIKSKKTAKKYEFSDYLTDINSYISMSKIALAEQYYKEGFACYQKNRFEEAAEKYGQALRYDPENASAKVEYKRLSDELSKRYYEKGMTYFTEGDLEKAKEYFKKSLSYNPKMKESQRALERIR